MIKKIAQIGNSWGLIIPKETLEFFQINPTKDKIQLTITENEIIIKKAFPLHHYREDKEINF